MPGVPSGRGCDACRKQKKKCDQSQPACGRCTRLNIACIGSGERRFKFKQQMVVASSGARNAGISRTVTILAPTRVPVNEATKTVSSFTFILGVKDIRYSLGCYGPFLEEIPKRMGNNDALDASVAALSSAFSSLSTRTHSSESLHAYGHALETLRTCLKDVDKARTIDTLCAIYIMLVVQVRSVDELRCVELY